MTDYTLRALELYYTETARVVIQNPYASSNKANMTSGAVQDSTAPPSVTAAVLKPSVEMPKGSQKVEELDFNEFSGRPANVDDLIKGMNNMGFQASSIGEAVKIINNMVCKKCRLLMAFAF